MSGDWRLGIHWSADGLIPVIAQDRASGRVLMLAWMNREALDATIAENRAVYWSRSRHRLWRQGEQAGRGPAGAAVARPQSTAKVSCRSPPSCCC